MIMALDLSLVSLSLKTVLYNQALVQKIAKHGMNDIEKKDFLSKL